MKTSAKRSPEQVNKGEKNSVLTINITNEELLNKMPAVVLVMTLPVFTGQPLQLLFANRGLLVHTGFDPETLKAPDTDFCSSLLFPDDQCIMKKAVASLMQNPFEEISGLVFRINSIDSKCLWVICNCRALLSGSGIPEAVISNWQVYDEKSFPKEGLRNCLKSFDREEYQKILKDLTKRETEVLSCIGKGFTMKETADKLFISYRTVETHLDNIKLKLDLHSINALSAFAISAGLC
jgi:DNA-binding CsgD family transcriptional regulator